MKNKTEEHRFKVDDDVTVLSDSNWLIGEIGEIGKVVSLEPADGEPEHCIAVRFPHIPPERFNDYMREKVPAEKKGWVYFKPESLALGIRPKTQKEIIDELVKNSQAHSSSIFKEPEDDTCLVAGCKNFAVGYGVYNTHGVGHVFKACKWHLDDHAGRWCDDAPFETKTKGLAYPPWFEEACAESV